MSSRTHHIQISKIKSQSMSAPGPQLRLGCSNCLPRASVLPPQLPERAAAGPQAAPRPCERPSHHPVQARPCSQVDSRGNASCMPAYLHSIGGHQLRSHQYRPGRQAADKLIAFVDKAAQRCTARARLMSGLRQAGVVCMQTPTGSQPKSPAQQTDICSLPDMNMCLWVQPALIDSSTSSTTGCAVRMYADRT